MTDPGIEKGREIETEDTTTTATLGEIAVEMHTIVATKMTVSRTPRGPVIKGAIPGTAKRERIRLELSRQRKSRTARRRSERKSPCRRPRRP